MYILTNRCTNISSVSIYMIEYSINVHSDFQFHISCYILRMACWLHYVYIKYTVKFFIPSIIFLMHCKTVLYLTGHVSRFVSR